MTDFYFQKNDDINYKSILSVNFSYHFVDEIQPPVHVLQIINVVSNVSVHIWKLLTRNTTQGQITVPSVVE